ncbi:hypothetical protein [Pararhizobium sp. PWRC1-1]|uniref:hypothetical protein n=1 Tax=Pararhizobium sp. PWRC1-1 TaxID=2804566 RepID=UPI003CF49EA8
MIDLHGKLVTLRIEKKPAGGDENSEIPGKPAGPVVRYCVINDDDSLATSVVLKSGATPFCILAGICVDYSPWQWMKNERLQVSVATDARIFQRWNSTISDSYSAYDVIAFTSIFFPTGRFDDNAAAVRLRSGITRRRCERNIELGPAQWPGYYDSPMEKETFPADPMPGFDPLGYLEMQYWLTTKSCNAGPPPL